MSEPPSQPTHDPAPPPPRERRRSKRVPMEAVVQYQLQGNEFIHLSTNISADGIFIKNFAPPPMGTELTFRVTLPEGLGGHQVELDGKVTRVVDPRGEDEPGMGIAFTAIRAQHPAAVRFFVSQIYDIDHLEGIRPEPTSPSTYSFQPNAEEALPLKLDRAATRPESGARIFSDPRQRLLWSVLLVAVGILLGAGSVLVFWR